METGVERQPLPERPPGRKGWLRLWRNHSLTIVLASLGSILTAAAHLFEPGNVFDTVLGLGLGVLTVALFYFAANFLREVAKPED